jgi:hypothetical protein
LDKRINLLIRCRESFPAFWLTIVWKFIGENIWYGC